MKKNNIKGIVKMVFCVSGTIVVSSCTLDEFYGINDETKGIAISTLYEIARSQEFIDYQKACFNFMEEISNIDTTQMIVYDVINGKPVYAKTDITAFLPVMEANKMLIDVYPEYSEANPDEIMEMQMIAISNNRTLKKLANKYMPSMAIKRTKSSNNENQAHSWLLHQHASNSNYSHGSGSEYVYQDDLCFCVLQIYSNSTNCVNDVINRAQAINKEFGGYAWNDGSAVAINDLTATDTTMHFPAATQPPYPSYDFHVHPSGNLIPSSADWAAWNGTNRYHYIFNFNGYASVFWQ